MVQRFCGGVLAASAVLALAIAPAAATTVVDSRTIFLDMSQAVMMDVAQLVLDEIVEQAKPDPSLHLTVTGHTDTTGSDAANLKLSAQRAQEVANYFISKGIAAGRITVIGKGEAEPMVRTGDGVREPLNRRVVIELTRP